MRFLFLGSVLLLTFAAQANARSVIWVSERPVYYVGYEDGTHPVREIPCFKNKIREDDGTDSYSYWCDIPPDVIQSFRQPSDRWSPNDERIWARM